jgi:hypothetical protein
MNTQMNLMVRARRVNINTRCTLICGDIDHPVILKNLSNEGALVTLLSGKLAEREINGLCNLILGNSSNLLTPKNACKIIRFDVDEQEIAVQFLEPVEDIPSN